MTGSILTDIFIALVAVTLVDVFLRRRTLATWKHPDSGIEQVAQIKGLNAFVGLSNDAIVSKGIWVKGFSGKIQLSKITNMQFDRGNSGLTVPRLVVTFLGDTGEVQTVRYVSKGTILGTLSAANERDFTDLCETALSRWQQPH